MKNFFILLFMLFSLPAFADTLPFYVDSIPKSALGVYQTYKELVLFSSPENNSNQIKKMVVGAGHADKNQVDMMVRTLLKAVPEKIPADASDALAISLCHGFMRPTFKIRI